MPIERIAGGEAINRLRTEGRRVRWPDQREPERRMDGLVTVTSKPGFQIRPGDRIFTMGSCFARNIERRLAEIGFATVMYDEGLLEELQALGHDLGYMNKYNSASIRAEMGWALGTPRPPEEHVVLPLGEGAHDLFAYPGTKFVQSTDNVRAARRIIESRAARIRDCRIVILTLGLAEVWYDSVSGLHINAAPPKSAIAAEPDRFFLDVYSYEEIVADLEAIHQLLQSHGHPDVHMLITVSPVPMSMTFRALDAMAANGYSKAVQRAAIEAFVCAHGNVDYFPSFEPITLTDRRISFEVDNRHVQPGIVSQIVDRFMGIYAPDAQFELSAEPLRESAPATAKDLAVAGKLHQEQRKFNAAIDFYSRAIESHGDGSLEASKLTVPHLRAKLAGCLYKADRLDDARGTLVAVMSDSDSSPRDLMAVARLAEIIGAESLKQEALDRLGATEVTQKIRVPAERKRAS
jgi:hypothetical protein